MYAPFSHFRPSMMQCAKELRTTRCRAGIAILLITLISSSEAQSLCSGSSPPSPGCICYPGLTNAPDCNRLACGSPYQNSTSRAPFDPTLAGASGSLGCGDQCTPGFAGSSCNICQNTDACQKGITAASSSGSGTPFGLSSAATGDVICSKEPIAFTASFGECSIDNPMIKSFLPGKLQASIQRYPDPTSASLPTSSIAGLSAGWTTVQLLYAPNTTAPLQDQFSCEANNCTQQVSNGIYSMTCQSLKCKCSPGSFLCGGGAIDLSTTINTISGDVGMDCPLGDNSTTSGPAAPCHIKMGLLKNIFGPQGFSLTDCQFGECVQKRLAASKRKELLDGGKSSISSGLIAGLAVVALIIAAFFGIIGFGFYRQRCARKTVGSSSLSTSAAAQVEWSNLRYYLPLKSGASSLLRRRRVQAAPRPADMEATKSITASSSCSLPPNTLSYGPQILCGLSGSVGAGTMMAILGPSGAGKSTFLDVLAGQQKAGKISGRRNIFLASEPDEPIVIGFVDQSDILPPTSTVREALMFSARLKLPEHVSSDERSRRVSEVVDLLGLSNVVDSRIGDDEKRGLSGGERRRLSIGLELIARPSVLFLDEPTSGLDSVSALRVVKVLKGLSAGATNGHGTTIICSIHQPNSQIYHAFDHVCLLALGGRQIYCGPTSDAVSYLGSRGLKCPAEYNPADFLLEVASEPPVGFLEHCMEADQVKSEITKDEASSQFPPPAPKNVVGKFGEPIATMITQLQVISRREWLCLKRDPSLFWFLNILSVIIGVFVGAMFFQVNLKISGFQNRVGSMFFTCAVFVFSSLSALTNFYRVRVLFMRERAAGFYSPTAWLIVRACFDVIPLRVLPMLTMGTIIYWMVGLTNDGTHFVKYLLVLLELGLVQTMFCMWLGASIRNLGTAVFLASMANLLQLGFAGFFVNLTSMTKVLRWVQYVIPLKFALEAMSVNEVSAGLMINDNLQGINVRVSASMIMGLLFGFEEDAYWRNVIILFGYFLFLASLLILTVIRKLRQVK
ncbi:uncharacterized protein PGTG_03161 [Puccinia graminis f. sp. tritici CRL 75-36-700-3]|uniref:ABC transporter domain-containing protein n=2 Tax=Puccinia graminis f. sp. tritici (strain CRL 75-36-700-3 / race SCCL) TaxID=418459 RepID=E3JYT0_PUCGT|nr:uncharacterized protein PGTG_03161 [Puccinia graminis f. sp. tritici CRL 75-36-700-3]EFP77205.2 hypothetical protein PGTG_03161 [Puccinia graminis f. sp. tritici CRL 75-36-700-3]